MNSMNKDSPLREYIGHQLKEMGFSQEKINRALKEMKAESIEDAMECIIKYQDGDGGKTEDGSDTEERPNTPELPETPQVVRTPEEIEAQKKKVEELIKERRLKRAEKDKNDAIEKEKSRRKSGTERGAMREKIENDQRIQMAKDMRQAKLDLETHKKSVLEEIRRDREAMKKSNPTSEITPSTTKPQPVAADVPKLDYANCRLAIRLPNGTSIQQDFAATEQLAAVRLFVQINRKDQLPSTKFSFRLPPTTEFSDQDMDKTLKQLGLCPSARLVVSDKKPLL